MAVTKADEEVIDSIAAGHGTRAVLEFRPSETARARVAELVARERGGRLTAEEASELDHYVQLEHIMRLAKARARQYLSASPSQPR